MWWKQNIDVDDFEDYFYVPYGRCFNGEAIVKLKNGKKREKDIKKGDILSNGAKVVCLVEKKFVNSKCCKY